MKEKTLGIIVVLIAFLIGSYSVLSRTGLVIQDTDPTTYVVVVLLMVFVMLFFSVKEELSISRDKRGIVYGSLMLLAYILIVSYLRLWLSFIYYSYRIDALLLPILLSGIIISVFGLGGIRKLWKQVVYALFASPLLLIPIIDANTKFVNSVAYITYTLMNLVKEPVIRNGIIITAPSTYSISIASTCADLGAFIAILMFLIPIAYFYNGRLRNKAYWIVSGVALFFVFNIARMFTISTVWVYYGINSAISLFHAFAGQILFYIAIIAMLLIAGKMGLHLPKGNKPATTRKRVNAQDRHMFYAAAFALLIGVIGLVFTLPYQSASYHPFTSFNTTVSSNTTALYRIVVTPLESAGMNMSILGSNNRTAILAMSNATYSKTNPLYVVATVENGSSYATLSNYSRALYGSSVIINNGDTINSALVYSNGHMFYVNYFTFPYYSLGNGYVIDYELFYYDNSSGYYTQYSGPSCRVNAGIVNRIESAIYNLVKFQAFSNNALCTSLRVVRG